MKTEWIDNRPKPRIEKRVYPMKLNRMPRIIEEQNIMADELIQWALLPDSILMEEFPLSKNISPYRFFKLADSKTNEYFTDAYEFANSWCGVKMQKGQHQLDLNLLNKIFPLYHKRYNEYLLSKDERAFEFQKQLKTIESTAKSGSTIIVQMEPAKSDIVPLCVNTTSE